MKIFLKYLFLVILLLFIKSETNGENELPLESDGVRLVNKPDTDEVSPNENIEIKKIWVHEQKRYKKISDDFRIMESHFKLCIDAMQDIDFTEEGVRNCVGINLQRPINDTNYEKKKQIALTETKLKKVMFFQCYEIAGLDEEFAEGCDILEKDLLDFLWAELNFYDIIEFNSKKYLFEFSKIPADAWAEILKEIHLLYKSMFDILNEIDVHQDLMVVQIRSYIDKRTVRIKNSIHELQKHPKPVIHKRKVFIRQIGIAPKKRIMPENIPRRIVMDGNPAHMFSFRKGPRIDDLIDNERYSEKRKETPYVPLNGPFVIFPDRKRRTLKRYV